LLASEHFRGLVDVLFAAFVAAGPKTGIDSRTSGDGVCLGKWDSVPEKQILPNVEPMVLAVDHPKIPAIFPHASCLQVVSRVGRDFSAVNNIKSSRATARIVLSESQRAPFFQMRAGVPALACLSRPAMPAGLPVRAWLTIIGPPTPLFLSKESASC
jgi:hypothetical protein